MAYPGKASYGTAVVGTVAALLRAMRPKQWTKNLLVYLALFFSINEAWGPHVDAPSLTPFLKATLALAVLSALSGAIYLINDIFDAEEDRRHPRKRFRPVAAGQLSPPVAWVSAGVLIGAALGVGFATEPWFGAVAAAYAATMVGYTVILKRLVLLDVFAISAGFVLRAVAGAAILQVPISPWLYICTGLGALFIALSKRRSELAAAGENAASQRRTLEWYTRGLLDQLIAVVAASVVVAYILYTFTASNLPDNHIMMLTIPFVLYGLFRYFYLVHMRNLGETPEDILISDVPLIAAVALWVASAASILAVFRG